jgi:hypothetical protein
MTEATEQQDLIEKPKAQEATAQEAKQPSQPI